MAYFSCMAGVGGKGNSVIVTCDADFAGIPITCTNGQKTYTKVCPSFSPYEVTFTGLVAGTWTISATVDGVVYSTTAVVTDITAVLSYGFAWQRWVDSSSSLHSEDYTDLADLLSDEEAIRQLFSEHAPTDYAASTATVTPDLATVLNNDLCAKWINLRDYALDTLYANPLIAAAMDSADKYFYGEWGIVDNTTTPPTWGALGNVPIMTSNNAPYGEVIFSDIYGSGYEAYKAFDGNAATRWNGNNSVAHNYVGYKSTNPICLKSVHIDVFGYGEVGNRKYGLGGFKIQGSNDGSNWVDLFTGDMTSVSWGEHMEVDALIDNNNDFYLYHRLYSLGNPVDSATDSVSIWALQFYGRELSVSVPAMTGNTTPYGEVNVSSYSTNHEGYKAFSGKTLNASDNTTYWLPSSGGTQTISYKFGKGIVCKMVKFATLRGSGAVSGLVWKIKGSNDGATWEELESYTFNITTARVLHVLPITNNVDYKYYELEIDGQYIVGELQFYGLDYSEKEFEEGSTKKWLYDHGLELETIVTNTYGSGSSVTKGSQSIYLKNSSSTNNSASLNAELDLSPYSLARAKIFNCLASGSVMGSIVVTATTADVMDNRIATINMNTNNGNDYALGLTSINQTYYVAMLCAASAASNPREMEVTEFWLE